MNDINSLSVVIPVYNSAPTLATLLERLTVVLDGCRLPYEVILVNDGSRDGSWEQIVDLAEKYPCLLGVNLMRNYGQHNALLVGIRHARHEVIVTMDDDLQHPPGEIPKLLERLSEGHDVVYGTPVQEQHGLWRDLASQISKLALKSAMGAQTARKVSALRAFRTQLREAFSGYDSSFVSLDVLLTWGTTRFSSVPVQHDRRMVGTSNYTFRKLTTHALNMMTGFSTWPLQLASLIGFAFTFFGMTILVYVIGRYLMEGGSVPGFPFLASIIAIFSGAQLFALGIIGEYLARMHYRTLGRPAGIVRDRIGRPCHQEDSDCDHSTSRMPTLAHRSSAVRHTYGEGRRSHR